MAGTGILPHVHARRAHDSCSLRNQVTIPTRMCTWLLGYLGRLVGRCTVQVIDVMDSRAKMPESAPLTVMILDGAPR
jgi:hypothetical protein